MSETSQNEAMKKRLRSKNLAALFVLLILALIFYGLAMVRMSGAS